MPNLENILTVKWRKYACLPRTVLMPTSMMGYRGVMMKREQRWYDNGPICCHHRGRARGDVEERESKLREREERACIARHNQQTAGREHRTTLKKAMISHSPSLMVPCRPRTLPTAGLTKNIVNVPVMPKTVHSNAISVYHFGVLRGAQTQGAT